MPIKNRSNPNKAQAKALNSAIKETASQIKNRERQFAKSQKEFQKTLELERKARDREYFDLLKNIRGKGIYDPKGNDLTPYRKRRLNKAKAQYGEYLNNQKYFFIPAPKVARNGILERAHSLDIETTKSGLFFPKQGHKRASLKKDKKRDEYYIERTGKTKTGPTKGRRYKSITPLASADDLDRERDRLREMAAELGPLAPGEALVFKVVENGGEGYSHSTFSNIELLLKYLDTYKKKEASKVNFFRHIQVEKSMRMDWHRAHPTRSPGRSGRKDTRGSKG